MNTDAFPEIKQKEMLCNTYITLDILLRIMLSECVHTSLAENFA